jgi:hydrogenase maturation protease
VNALVVGLGSVLMGDDAAGPYLVEWLGARYQFPPGVTLLDAGTPGPELFQYLEGYDAVIVVDSVHAPAPPGAVRLYRGEQLTELPPQPRLSPHDPGLREALLTSRLSGRGPRDVLLVGVVPGRVALPPGLTDEVRAAVPEMAGHVVAELTRLGLAPRALAAPRAGGPWWESETPQLPAQDQGGLRGEPASRPR